MRSFLKVAPKVALISLALAGSTQVWAQNTSQSAFLCDTPVLQVVEDSFDTRSLFSVECRSASALTVAPKLIVSGQVSAVSEAPYLVNASYSLDARSLVDQQLGVFPENQQTILGNMLTSTNSVAVLPTQFSSQTAWDAENTLFSIEEAPDTWRVFKVNYLAQAPEPVITNLGVLSSPVSQGRSKVVFSFDQSLSRFASEKNIPSLEAFVGVKDNSLGVLPSSTVSRNHQNIQDSIKSLDADGTDMARVWDLASKATYLGLKNEVSYALQKAAAANPHLLQEIQRDLQKIHSFTLPQ